MRTIRSFSCAAVFAIFAVLASALAGCGGGAGKESQALVVYDFGVPAQALVADGRWSRFALEVRSPPWFESLNIDYRLGYDDPLKPREYTASRWAGTPATLLGQRLRQQLGMQSAASNTLADCLLRIELQEFSQVFDTPQQSRALVQGNASLVDAKRQLVASRRVASEQKAASADARGGVMALVAASDELARELASWLGGLEQAQALKGCGAAARAG